MALRQVAAYALFIMTDSNPVVCQQLFHNEERMNALLQLAFLASPHPSLQLYTLSCIVNCIACGYVLPTETLHAITEALLSHLCPSKGLEALFTAPEAPVTETAMEMEESVEAPMADFGVDGRTDILEHEETKSLISVVLDNVKLAAEITANFILVLSSAEGEDGGFEDWDSGEEDIVVDPVQRLAPGVVDKVAWEYAAPRILQGAHGTLQTLYLYLSSVCALAATKALQTECKLILHR